MLYALSLWLFLYINLFPMTESYEMGIDGISGIADGQLFVMPFNGKFKNKTLKVNLKNEDECAMTCSWDKNCKGYEWLEKGDICKLWAAHEIHFPPTLDMDSNRRRYVKVLTPGRQCLKDPGPTRQTEDDILMVIHAYFPRNVSREVFVKRDDTLIRYIDPKNNGQYIVVPLDTSLEPTTGNELSSGASETTTKEWSGDTTTTEEMTTKKVTLEPDTTYTDPTDRISSTSHGSTSQAETSTLVNGQDPTTSGTDIEGTPSENPSSSEEPTTDPSVTVSPTDESATSTQAFSTRISTSNTDSTVPPSSPTSTGSTDGNTISPKPTKLAGSVRSLNPAGITVRVFTNATVVEAGTVQQEWSKTKEITYKVVDGCVMELLLANNTRVPIKPTLSAIVTMDLDGLADVKGTCL